MLYKKFFRHITLLIIFSSSYPSFSTELATFAAGCFWCTEHAFQELPGVSSAISGFMGGHVANPSYTAVSAGKTGHVEVVQLQYDPTKISYEQLLEVFWKNVDPTVENRQFCDIGAQYRSAIFTHTPEQKQAALKSKLQLERSGKFSKIYTEVNPASEFYPAEENHQDYFWKNPLRYRFYVYTCGRKQRLEKVWGDK